MARVPRAKPIQKYTDGELVLLVRKLLRDHITYRLLHNGEEPDTGSLLTAAQDEVNRRRITINHPERV